MLCVKIKLRFERIPSYVPNHFGHIFLILHFQIIAGEILLSYNVFLQSFVKAGKLFCVKSQKLIKSDFH